MRDKLGPILWQLPPNLGFDADRLAAFFARLPRSHRRGRVAGPRTTTSGMQRPGADRHRRRPAVAARAGGAAPGFTDAAFLALLREHGIAVVVADTAGRWPLIREVTARFGYVRLHGDKELYISGYTEERARRVGGTVANVDRRPDATCYVYFDNDVKVRAPFDAMALGRASCAESGQRTDVRSVLGRRGRQLLADQVHHRASR